MQRSAAHAVAIYGESGHSTADSGTAAPTLLFGHGLGGRPSDWQPLVEAFRPRFRVITFAQAGSRDADPSLFHPARHGSTLAFADDLSLLCAELNVRGAIFVGHSLGATAGALAAAADPGLFSQLVLLNGSACYVDDPATGYRGGFSSEQMEELLQAVALNFEAWAAGFAPLVMGKDASAEEVLEFVRVLNELDPVVAASCFRAAFRSDSRQLVGRITAPTLVLQSANDPAVPLEAATWLAAAIPNGRLQRLSCEGHFPHIVDPVAVITAIASFLEDVRP